MSWLEPLIGVFLLGAALLDLFLTVLYARAGAGYISDHVARATWLFFVWISRAFGKRRPRLLSFGGPAILVMLVASWSVLLIAGAALIMHPYLGSSVKANSGPTDTNFLVVLYAGGSSMSMVGSSDYSPKTTAFRMVFLANSLIGMSVLSLSLTYIMQIYSALQRRNSLGLGLDLMAGGTGDAATLLKGLGPGGKFESGTSALSQIAQSMANMREGHEFYPVLFYFRFSTPKYAVSRMTLMALDSVSLIRTAIGGEENRWLREFASVNELWNGSMALLKRLEGTFLPGERSRHEHHEAEERKWRARYDAAVDSLRDAGIPTDNHGAGEYIALRRQWDSHIRQLAAYMQFSMQEVDPVTESAEAVNRALDPAHDGRR